MSLQEIYDHVKRDLEQIESELVKAVQTHQSTLFTSATHLLAAGGKRIRPIFVLLSGRIGTYDRDRLQQVAVALELIHMATLVHDDVVDDATTRRGRKTVRVAWDNKVAVYTGDYIFARALEVISLIDDPVVHQVLAKAMVCMCRGEIAQMQQLFSPDQSLKGYLQRVKRKTALLMAISCQLGAVVSQVPPRRLRALTRYGHYVGMSFQLTDDILDLMGDEKVLGKPVGSDLRQGNVTLPVIYASYHGSTQVKKRIRAYLVTAGKEGGLPELLEMVRQTGGIQYAFDLSNRYLAKALQSLEELPASGEKESLQMMAEFMVRRAY
jgi:heptaprenyl diphosphate synthase